MPPEVWISLETSSYQCAVKKVDDAHAKAMKRFQPQPQQVISLGRDHASDQAEEQWAVLASDQAAPLARAFFAEAVRELDGQPPDPAQVGDEQRRAWKQELEAMLARLVGSEPEDGIDDVAGAMLGVLQRARLRNEEGSEAGTMLRNYLRRAMAQAIKIELARLCCNFT